jgi:SAM-dependent methyltransferase
MSRMNEHFSKLSACYNELRTTDVEPVLYVRERLQGQGEIRAADIGCGAGRYDLLLLQHLPGVHLTCADVNGAMVEETARYLKSHGQSNFVAQRIDASDMRLPDGTLDCVVTFNAIHHFDPVAFLGQAAQAVKSSGQVFVYTRLKDQNARNIWGRFFPGFPEKETRLYDLGCVESWADRLNGLNLETIEFFRFERVAPLERLVDQAVGKHYSTFSLYSADELRKALEIFEARLAQHFMGCDQIKWTDENVMMVFRKN